MWTEDITTANYRINQSQVLFLETGVRGGDFGAEPPAVEISSFG